MRTRGSEDAKPQAAKRTMHQQLQFLTVLDRDEAERRFRAALGPLAPLPAEVVALSAALGRVLAGDVTAPVDVPGFDRSNVDGFAVRAADTFGATETEAISLVLNAEVIPTGVRPEVEVGPGTASAIATGGMLPRGADAVVMIEHTDVKDGRLLVRRPATPGANVSFAGTDIGMGEVVLRDGELLTSRETGVLAALGLAEVPVVRRPRVAILSTGDELIPPGEVLGPGRIYDSNSTVLADAVRELGGEPIPLGIVPDDLGELGKTLRGALPHCDLLLLSGGTSKGAGDVSYRAVADLGSPGIVAHGVALKPGKPLCLAVVREPQPAGRRSHRPVPVAVLPGFPTSAIFTFHEFLAPVLRELVGRPERAADRVGARLPFRVNSERGRTEYLLVNLVEGAAGPAVWTAYPMGKGSGSVTAFARADGFLVIPRQREYLEAGEEVEVHLLASALRPADLVAIGSHCTGLDYLLGELHRRGFTSKALHVGSTGGLEAAGRGECDVAGVHLLDPETDTYNVPFVKGEVDLVKGYVRQQGIVFRPGDERFEGRSLEELAAVFADAGCVMVNRNRGSGTRILTDRLLGGRRPAGYHSEARSHNAVVAAVVQGRADWGVAIEPVARAAGLGFLPVRAEEYDFLIPRARRDRPAVRAFVELLQDASVRAELARRGFPAG
jgi:putative molybdopterin biosynthesis protein